MAWVEDGTSNATLALEAVAFPKAALVSLGFEDQAGNPITKAKAGALIFVRLTIKNVGEAGSLAGTVDRLDTGARIIDTTVDAGANTTHTFAKSITMPNAALTVTARWWHWE